MALADAGEPSPAVEHIPVDLVWRKVDPSGRTAILEFLMTQTRGNYERIRTLQASYEVQQEQYLSPAFVKDGYGSRLPKDSSPDLINESKRTLTVVIDMESGAIFRQVDTNLFRLLTTDTRKPVIVPNVQLVDNRSIVTSADYKSFDPKRPPATHKVVANQPKGQNKRYASRVPAEKSRNREYGDLIDPRDFFCCSSNQKSWDEIQTTLSALKGDKGAEQQQIASMLEIDQADQEGRKWYRLRLPVSSKDGTLVIFTSIWSPSAGFNPVSQTVSIRNNTGEAITQTKSWKWKEMDGIFVPAVVHEVWHPKDTPHNVDTLNRTVTLKKCVLSAPLAPNQFDYTALGLKSGDLILDDIEQTIFIMDESGQPTRLAAYNEEYVPEVASAKRSNWRLVIGSIASVIAIALAGVILRRRWRGVSTT
jgi:hypothetical protein